MERDIGRMQWTTGAVILGALVVGGMAYASQADVLPKIQSGITKALIAKPDVVINENDPKWIKKGNYGENGRFLMDKDGNAVVTAIDTSKPIRVLDDWATATNGENYGSIMGKSSYNTDLITITFTNKVVLVNSGGFTMFSRSSNLKEINGLDKFDTSQSTDMSFMFDSLPNIKTLDLSTFDTKKVFKMVSMFANDKSLTELNITNFNTDSLKEIDFMFLNDRSISSLDMSKFNTQNVSSMLSTFEGMTSLKSLNISNWNTSNVTQMSYLFKSNTSLKTLDVSNWNVSKVDDMRYSFSDMTSLESLDLTKWNVSNVKDMSFLFYGDKKLLSAGDLSKWGITSEVNTNSAFWQSGVNDVPSWYK